MTISIALDAMGGDNAPREVVAGAVQAVQDEEGLQIFLVGFPDQLERELAEVGGAPERIEIVPAESAIGMGDSPVESLNRNRRSSIEVAMHLVRDGRAAAFVSAGNTGACVAAASLFLRRLPAVRRPGIAVVFHTGNSPVVVIDVGANINCKPEHLIQYGVMASLYAEEILGVSNPKVGLLNIGEEDEKGHVVAKQTRSLFTRTKLNFEGNVEGAEIFHGDLSVVVCDGFVGNIVLKVSEGLAERLLRLFFEMVRGSLSALPGTGSVGPALEESFLKFARRFDYSEYGGAPLLGVNGTVIIAHGRSDSKAIANAIKVAGRMAAVDLNARISAELQSLSLK